MILKNFVKEFPVSGIWVISRRSRSHYCTGTYRVQFPVPTGTIFDDKFISATLQNLNPVLYFFFFLLLSSIWYRSVQGGSGSETPAEFVNLVEFDNRNVPQKQTFISLPRPHTSCHHLSSF